MPPVRHLSPTPGGEWERGIPLGRAGLDSGQVGPVRPPSGEAEHAFFLLGVGRGGARHVVIGRAKVASRAVLSESGSFSQRPINQAQASRSWAWP